MLHSESVVRHWLSFSLDQAFTKKVSLQSKTEQRSDWTDELGRIHFFTKVLGEVVISVGATNY